MGNKYIDKQCRTKEYCAAKRIETYYNSKTIAFPRLDLENN
jgi:hypothetical protein